MRTMYDSVDPFAIPVAAGIVAGYVDGLYRWPDNGWTRFSGIKVRIAVFASTNDGVVLDVENGDATPVQAPGWVQKRRAAGVDPTVYCSLAAWPAVIAAFYTAHVAEPHYWIAAYPGNGPVLPAGAVAHQYVNPPNSGGNWDLSVVSDYWPGVDLMTAPYAQWTDLLPNPLFDKTITDSADVRSHATYTAEQYIQGSWVNTLGVKAELDVIVAAIAKLSDSVTNVAAVVGAIKAALPAQALTGTATVTVNLVDVPSAEVPHA